MSSRRRTSLLIALAFALPAGAVCLCRPGGGGAGGPRSMAEVVRRAEAAGLGVVSPRGDGALSDAAVLYEVPTTPGQAAALPGADRASPRWRGRVMVKAHVPGLQPDPDGAASWGRFVLWGDPALVARLAGR